MTLKIKLLRRLLGLVLLIDFCIISTLIFVIISKGPELIINLLIYSWFIIGPITVYLTFLIDKIKEEEFVKVENFNIKNHRFIIHEIIHSQIHEKFGFKEWKIISKNDHRDLVCIMTIPESGLLPKYLPKIFLWALSHFVHDVFLRFFILDIQNIVEYTKEYISSNIEIIKEIIKN